MAPGDEGLEGGVETGVGEVARCCGELVLLPVPLPCSDLLLRASLFFP